MDSFSPKLRRSAWLGLAVVLLAAALFQIPRVMVRRVAATAGEGVVSKAQLTDVQETRTPRKSGRAAASAEIPGVEVSRSQSSTHARGRAARESLATAVSARGNFKPASEPEEDSPVVAEVRFRVPLVYRITDAAFRQRLPEISPAVLEPIRKDFEKSIGADYLATDDPEYAVRWQRAEPTAAQRMRTLFGWSAAADFERQAALDAAGR